MHIWWPLCVILLLTRSRYPCLLIWAGLDGEDILWEFQFATSFETWCRPCLQVVWRVFVSQYAISEWQDFKFSKVHQYNGESIDVFYNQILKFARQCQFSNINERLIDAIIFGTNCTKAQDKLLQTPKTLSLQQCLSVVKTLQIVETSYSTD